MPPEISRGAPPDAPPPQAALSISDQEFESIRRLVKGKTGISLGLHKRDLVISRLSRRLRVLGLANFSQYIDYLGADLDVRHSEGQRTGVDRGGLGDGEGVSVAIGRGHDDVRR